MQKKCGNSIEIYCQDAQNMSVITDDRCDLVITSPPYNVNLNYTEYNDNLIMEDYLAMLERVMVECYRVMKPGSRICLNVAHGTGRQPYLPIGAEVTLLLRKHFELLGTIIWRKTTALLRTSWGSWRRPSTPYLRDLCELIIISKKPGHFEVPDDFLVNDRGIKVSPWLDADTFTTLTRDIWEFETSTPSKALGHPASFPLELPIRLIKLFAYRGATILDPFAGSGTTGLAAKELGCSAILLDIDPNYFNLMTERFAQTTLFEATA